MDVDSTLSSTPLSEPKLNPRYFDTRVYGRNETGITVLDEGGRGTFFPDEETTLPEPGFGNSSKQKTGADYQEKSPALEALYPQWTEGQGEIGIAVRLVSNALSDLERLLEPCTNETESLNYFVLAETQLFQALSKARFNKAFEIVVSFCAWGVRNMELGLPEAIPLQRLCSALRELSEQPFLSINRAASLIAILEKQGWRGESPVSRSFEEGLSAIFDQEQIELV